MSTFVLGPPAARDMETRENCTTDLDCPANLLCVVNASWNPPNTSWCDCNYQYGWQDISTNCTTFGIPFYLQFAATLIVDLWNFLAMLLLISDLIYQYQHTKIDFRTAVSTTTQFLMVCFLLRTIYWTILLVDSLYPTRYALLGHEKVSTTWVAQCIFVIAQSFFGLVALLNLSFQWIEVAERSKNLKSSKAKNVSRYKNVIRVSMFLFLVVILVSFGTLNFNLATICSFPIVVLILYTYSMGARMLTSILEGAGSNTASETIRKSTKTVVQRIRTTALYLFIIVLISLVFTILSFLISLTKKRTEWESGPWLRADVFVQYIVAFLVLLSLSIVIRYVHLSIRDHGKKPGTGQQESGTTSHGGVTNVVVAKVVAAGAIAKSESVDELSAETSKNRTLTVVPAENGDLPKIKSAEDEATSSS